MEDHHAASQYNFAAHLELTPRTANIDKILNVVDMCRVERVEKYDLGIKL